MDWVLNQKRMADVEELWVVERVPARRDVQELIPWQTILLAYCIYGITSMGWWVLQFSHQAPPLLEKTISREEIDSS